MVCASHFAEIDVTEYGQKGFTVNKDKNTKTTRNSARIKGNNSLDMPPIPCQTMTEILNKNKLKRKMIKLNTKRIKDIIPN